MRLLSFVIGLAGILFLFSCSSNKKNKVPLSNHTYIPLDLLEDQLIDMKGDTIVTRGLVTHVCKHSGQRLFITEEHEKSEIRIESTNQSGNFNKMMEGSYIEVTGILKKNENTLISKTGSYVQHHSETGSEQNEEGKSASQIEKQDSTINTSSRNHNLWIEALHYRETEKKKVQEQDEKN